jgi:type IV pilus assembly protein PilA
MKKLEERKLNNNGFSLVELIIVIAIMAVLVGVLSPQFIKYVEQSRRATDIQNAESIRTAVLADIADGTLKTSVDSPQPFVGKDDKTYTSSTDVIKASTITETPKIAGNLTLAKGSIKGQLFYVTYNVTAGTCQVYTDVDKTYELTTPGDANSTPKTGAAGYKVAEDYKATS